MPEMDTPTSSRPGTLPAVEERVARLEGDLKLMNLKMDHQGEVFNLRLGPMEKNIEVLIAAVKGIESLINRALAGDTSVSPNAAAQQADWQKWRSDVTSQLESIKDDRVARDAVGRFSGRIVAVGITVAGVLSGIAGALITHLTFHP